MKRFSLAAAISAACASAAWGQAPPPGTYQFVSGPGVGTPPFTVTGFSTSLGGSIGLTHLPNCGGLHVHGTFNSFADPNSGGCGHGIISLVQSVLPGASSQFPGSMPGSARGMLALTRGAFKISDTESPRPATRIFFGNNHSNAGDLFVDAFEGLAPSKYSRDAQLTGERGAVRPSLSFVLEFEQEDDAAERQKRDDAAAAKAKADRGGDSILDSITEPTPEEIRKELAAQQARRKAADAAAAEEERKFDEQAQDIVDSLFSGDAGKSKAAASLTGFASKEMQNRIARKINDKVQKIVNDAMRAATNAAAGAPRIN